MTIEQLFGGIAQQGLLGILLVLSLMVVYRLYLKIDALQEARLLLAEKVFKIAEALTDLLEKNGGRRDA